MILLPNIVVVVSVVCIAMSRSSKLSRILLAYRDLFAGSGKEATTARRTAIISEPTVTKAALAPSIHRAAKSEQSTSREESPKKQTADTSASEYCHLDDLELPGSIHLWSMITASSYSMIEHFVKHYRKVGVPLDNMSFLVHHDNENEKRNVLSILEEVGIGTDKISFVDQYHSDIKRDAVNKHIESLSKDAWLVYPELDELFHFPCLSGGPDTFRSFCGTMVDRFATTKPGIAIPPIAAMSEQSIAQQYPKCRQARGDAGIIFNANGSKNLLFPVQVETSNTAKYRARFSSSHSLWYMPLSTEARRKSDESDPQYDFKAVCELDRGAIDHYSWSEEQVDLAYKRLVLYSNTAEKEKDKKLREQNEKRMEVYKEMLIMMERNADAKTWSLKENWAKAVNDHKALCPKTAKKGEGKMKTSVDRLNGEPVHVVFSANADSVNGVEASIRSIRQHSSGPVEFYFIGDVPLPNMPEVTFFNLTEIVEKYAIEDFMNREVPRKDHRKDTINVYYSNYARFAIDQLLINQKKAMYLDVDSLVFCDVYSLINNVLNDENDTRAVAAVPRTSISWHEFDGVEHVIRGLTEKGAAEFPSVSKSFNAGIYIMHLDKWRSQNLTEKMRQIALKNREEGWYWLGSQPPLNLVIGDQFEDLGEEWNRSTDESKYRKARNVLVDAPKDKGICMLHYKGGRKPWNGEASKHPQTLWNRYGNIAKK